jgi:hypothetical protein
MNKPCQHVKAEQISHLIIKHISATGVLTLKSSMDELKRLASKDTISDNDRIVINVLSGDVARLFTVLEPLLQLSAFDDEEINYALKKAAGLCNLARENNIITKKCPCSSCEEINEIIKTAHAEGKCK